MQPVRIHSNPKSFNPSLNSIIVGVIFGIIFSIMPLCMAYKIMIPNLKTINWDDTAGTVTSVIITYTGRSKMAKGSHRSLRLYKSTLNYNYQNNGEIYTNAATHDLQGESNVNNYKKKYYQGASINLKINPQDRSESVIKPNYLSDIICLIATILVALVFFILFCIIFPLQYIKIKKEKQAQTNISPKIEAQSSGNASLERARDKKSYNKKISNDVHWMHANDSSSKDFSFYNTQTNQINSAKKAIGCFIAISLFMFLAISFFVFTHLIR